MNNNVINKNKVPNYIKKDNRFMVVLLAPAVIIVLVVTFFPLIYTFFLSFQDYKLTNPSEAHFVGIQNYLKLISDPVIRQSIRTTFIFTFSSVGITLIIGVLLAVVIDNLSSGKTFFRISLFTPMMLSSVVVGVIWRFLLNIDLGVINYLFDVIGIGRINWLSNTALALTSIILADVWQWTSYTFILVLAALESLNPELMDAAKIDGAGPFLLFTKIKLPLIAPVLGVSLTFRFIWAFRNFELPYALTKGGPGTSTETMALKVWRIAFTQYDIGTSSAVSALIFFIMIIASIFILRKTKSKV